MRHGAGPAGRVTCARVTCLRDIVPRARRRSRTRPPAPLLRRAKRARRDPSQPPRTCPPPPPLQVLANAQFNEIGTAHRDFYQTLDTNAALQTLYNERSLLTYEGKIWGCSRS